MTSSFPAALHITLLVCVCPSISLCVSHAQTHGDERICWQVNFERFHLHFRDQAIISAVVNKLDQVSFSHMNILNMLLKE